MIRTGLFTIILLGIMSNSCTPKVVIDSNYTFEQAVSGTNAPDTIIKQLVLIDVEYYGFDNLLHKGQIVINKSIGQEVKAIFEYIKETKFPLKSVIPIVYFGWDDDLSMEANNTSSFNYRVITGNLTLSKHATGEAVDFNPFQNPYIKKDIRLPKGATYDTTTIGTITAATPFVEKLLAWSWVWGGNWQTLKDYQHFEK